MTHRDLVTEDFRETNPLIAVLMETGWVIHHDSVVSGAYYMTNPLNDEMLYVHAPLICGDILVEVLYS